jgi:hypothetical protein
MSQCRIIIVLNFWLIAVSENTKERVKGAHWTFFYAKESHIYSKFELHKVPNSNKSFEVFTAVSVQIMVFFDQNSTFSLVTENNIVTLKSDNFSHNSISLLGQKNNVPLKRPFFLLTIRIGPHQAPFPYPLPWVSVTAFLAVSLYNWPNSSPYTLQPWRWK